ncbi:DEAD/DEAH box helicase [Pedobacter yulinensis]|uniref:DEAD/DEAH box helicase n=1 Tax=Pedobacter yulinensis TaxID=2126353 RepID=A0A2T3HH35_9SPHI|nr:DEAD/DEAH box helicase [Pedobacter yulinensis]PST81749.1 DEAD/DEAH box helicase [Pedobacter yulinensis]
MSKSFDEFKLNRQILNAVADAGYEVATPIQEKAIGPVLSGQDLFGVAETGTGKTAAYVLPILMKLKYAQDLAPRALILAPTRELAMQIEEQVRLFAKYTDLRSLVIYGGIGPKVQTEAIARGVDILVATPGRFLDIYLDGKVDTKSLKFLVLDEADKMMDMGFIGSIHRILEVVPRKRQNLLFSATMSDLVQKIAGDFLKFPTYVEAAPQATPASNVSQKLYFVPNFKTKINLLQQLLKNDIDFSRLIIFCKTKTVADNIFSFIERRFGSDAVRVIHANKGQNTRINSINDFREGNIRVLVATDVAARGIDVTDVSHVINFDVPIIIEDYVHRIGRTGRAFAKGDALTFCTDAEKYYIKKIEQLIRQQIPVEPLPEGVFIEETPFDERQAMAREIDAQKRKENPDFKGAFHEKKHVKAQQKKPANTSQSKPKHKNKRFDKPKNK